MYKHLLLSVLLIGLVLCLFVGCDEDNPAEPETINEFELLAAATDEYLSTYPSTVNITIGDFSTLLLDGDTSNDPFIVDYRAAAEFNDKHFKNAVNISLGDLLAKIEDGTIPTNKTIVNVCYTGQTASVATAVLNLLGFEARNLKFGMCAVDVSIAGGDKWSKNIKSTRTLVSEATTSTATHDFPSLSTKKTTAEDILKAQFAANTVASDWKVTNDAVWDNPNDYFVINYWPAAEYENPGHIPGAIQFTPKTSLLSTSTLNKLPTDKTIVIYCYTGQTSAQVTACLRLLGYDAKSLLFGVNGFAYESMIKGQYVAPDGTADYSAILE